MRFYDFRCAASKSVSVQSMFNARLAETHEYAVKMAHSELKRFAARQASAAKSYEVLADQPTRVDPWPDAVLGWRQKPDNFCHSRWRKRGLPSSKLPPKHPFSDIL